MACDLSVFPHQTTSGTDLEIISTEVEDKILTFSIN